MSNILLLQDRVRNTIELGESHFREFKSAFEGRPETKRPRPIAKICYDIGEALVAFANADGGDLIIGVEDSGVITGIPHSEEQIEQMLAAPETHVMIGQSLPMTLATVLEIEDKKILFFSVSKGSSRIFQLPDSRCVRRKDKVTVPALIDEMQFERQEIRSREYDRGFVDGATVNDLDLDLIRNMADQYLRGLSPERYLQQMGLAEYVGSGLRLRMAGLLLFAKDIRKWHSHCAVRILKIAGNELNSGENYNVQSDEIVHDNIFELLIQSWEKLRPQLAYKTHFGIDAKFEQKYIYPEQACREALVNAIAHRDYSVHGSVDVYIFDDRMEIKSPGSLLSTLAIKDLEKLQGVHESRNSLIARLLRENKFMRELGEGMKRIFEQMELSQLQKPRLISDNNSFAITLFNKSVYDDRQLAWLSLFEPYSLSPLQKRIVVVGIDGRELSPKDIYKAMNTRDRDTYDSEVTELRKHEILIQTKTKVQANNYAKIHNIDRAQVPRFKVQNPLDTQEAMTPAHRTVYVGNLPETITVTELENIFSPVGRIEKIDILVDPITLRQRGFAFIQFVELVSALSAIRDFDGFEIKGNQILVSKYIIKDKEVELEEDISERTVYVTNFPSETYPDELKNLFEKCGPVESVIIPSDPISGVRRTFGFVRYKNSSSAKLAVKELDKALVKGKRLIVNEYLKKSNIN